MHEDIEIESDPEYHPETSEVTTCNRTSRYHLRTTSYKSFGGHQINHDNESVYLREETTKKDNIKQHVAEDSPEKPHCCVYCSSSFQFYDSLSAHIKRFHSEVKIDTKETINLSVENVNPEKKDVHLLSKTVINENRDESYNVPGSAVSFKCGHESLAERKFEGQTSGNTKVKKKYRCTNCQMSFARKMSLNRHLQNVHLNPLIKHEGLSSIKATDEQKEPSEFVEKSALHSCYRCPFVSKLSHSIILHQIVHTTRDGEPYNCTVCGYETFRPKDLNRHILEVHTKEKQNKCPHCNLSFARYNVLCKHITRVHPTSTINCKKCDFSSVFPDDIDTHFIRYHLLNCPHCNMFPSSYDGLLEHIKAVHQNVAIPCQYCDFTSRNLQVFNKHIRNYHLSNHYNGDR